MYPCGESAVLKLFRPGFGGHRAEAVTLRSLDGNGVAPRLLDVVQRDGRPGLVLQRLPGPDMLTLLQRRPWRVLRLARQLAETHLAVHRLPAPAALPALREVLAERIAEAALSQRLMDFVSSVLDALPDGDRLCHGDYHPGNVLVTPTRASVVDWGAATRGVPEADHARSLLLLRWAAPLPGSSLLSRLVIASGRSLLASAYARAYAQGPLPSRAAASWLVVHAAARLSEGIPAERDMLIGRLDRARRRFLA